MLCFVESIAVYGENRSQYITTLCEQNTQFLNVKIDGTYCYHLFHGRKAFYSHIIGFEVLTAVVLKNSVLWDISPCSPFKITEVSEKHVAFIFRVEE
jgi:hypothetical protein